MTALAPTRNVTDRETAGVAMGACQPARLGDDGGRTTAARLALLGPQRRGDKRFPLLEYVDIGERFSTGAWIVLFKRQGCHVARSKPGMEATILFRL